MTGFSLMTVRLLHIDKLLRFATPHICRFVATLVSKTSSGKRPIGRAKKYYSMINVTDACFSPPLVSAKSPKARSAYSPQMFPFPEPTATADPDDSGLNKWRAHFLSLCVKAAYEEEELFESITKNEWAPFRYEGMLETEDFGHESDQHLDQQDVAKVAQERHRQLVTHFKGDQQKAKVVDSFMPQTRAFIIRNDQAVILTFRGTEPTNLVQWATDASCNLQRQDEVQGEVHEGFYTALFWHSKKSQGAKFIVTKHGMFRRICEALWEVIGTEKSLYVTGHSLGGALRVMHGGGIYTFAGPLVGDNAFRVFMGEQFGERIFRVVHAGDWVPQVPPYVLEYRHHMREYYLNTLGTSSGSQM
ncbi:hypothetical protein WJX84_009205 [Apatococcus fuscideae]|uniref:Fungal lipase-type domain-containing protein n=1 Tax=Apatococcus fuscideae TaxID=2026836 RepID=A0AAW1T3Z7_9CHLO